MPTFLFTDIEGSTRKWEAHPEIMGRALDRHNAILKAQLDKYGGRIIKHTGDGMFAVFESGEPIVCIVEIQREIQKMVWGPIKELRVRAALHAGPARKVGDDYFGPVINRAARLLSIGWGGQILLTPEVVNAHDFPPDVQLQDLGVHQLKDLSRSQPVFGLVHVDFVLKEFPALRSLPTKPAEAEAVSVAPSAAPQPPAPPPAPAPELETVFNLTKTFDQTHTFFQHAAYGGRGKLNGQFMFPAGAAIDKEGWVYVSDAIQGTIQVFDLEGRFMRRLGAEGGALDTGLVFKNPSALAVDRMGLIYACDTKNCRIQIFTQSGEIVKQVGRPLIVVGRSEPPGPVGFNLPRGLALDEEQELLYVSDTGNNRVRLLKMDGTPVQVLGQHGQHAGEFIHPLGLAVGPHGHLYVADSENHRIQVFERGFKFVRSIGRRGSGPGSFSQPPTDMVVTKHNELIVCDGTNRLQIFDSEGKILGSVSQRRDINPETRFQFGHTGDYVGSVSGQRLEAASPKYVALALREPKDLIAIDDNGCQWHHFVYKEVTE